MIYGTARKQVYSTHWTKRVPRKSFARHEELHAFDARVSRLLAQASMLASYAARDLDVLTHIPTRDGFPMHVNLLASRFTQWLLTHVPLLRIRVNLRRRSP